MEVKEQESYPTIMMTLYLLSLHEELNRVPIEAWSEATLSHVLGCDLAVRSTEFVLAVWRGVSVEEALPIPRGSDLLNADRLLKLKMHCENIHGEVSVIGVYIVKVLAKIAEKEGLNADTDPAKVAICPAGIRGVWLCDTVIPEDVATKFKNEVAVLESVPDDKKDWYLHSKKQVLDLVHPSLFCCVFGQTVRVSSALDPSSFSSPSEQMQGLMFSGSEVVEQPNGCNTAFQWIPSDFAIADRGRPGEVDVNGVRTLSYINNLHRSNIRISTTPSESFLGGLFRYSNECCPTKQ